MGRWRRWGLPLTGVLVVAALALLACGGQGGREEGTPVVASLTDPRTVPTATPWERPPEVIWLEEGAPPGAPGAGPGSCGEIYVVQSGDILVRIAERCGVSLDELLRANPGIDPRALHVGQRIRIPR